jgi:hypothetical protein
MGRKYSTCEREERCIENFGGGDPLEDPGIDGTTIVEWFFEKWDGDHDLDISGSG